MAILRMHCSFQLWRNAANVYGCSMATLFLLTKQKVRPLLTIYTLIAPFLDFIQCLICALKAYLPLIALPLLLQPIGPIKATDV